MEFRPSLWKLIVSFIFGLACGVYSSIVLYIGGNGPKYVFSISSVIGFFIGFFLFYLIWSLIQRKQ